MRRVKSDEKVIWKIEKEVWMTIKIKVENEVEDDEKIIRDEFKSDTHAPWIVEMNKYISNVQIALGPDSKIGAKLKSTFDSHVYLSVKECKDKKSDRKDESKARKLIDVKHPFNKEIEELVDILHEHRSRSPQYEKMMKNIDKNKSKPLPLLPSKHAQYKKWYNFVSSVSKKIPNGAKKRFLSRKGVFNCKPWRDSGYKVMFSKRFACAGSLPNNRVNCQSCEVTDLSEKSQSMGDFSCDHLISKSQLGRIYKIYKRRFSDDKDNRKLLDRFIIHCFISLVPDEEMGWPSNLYYRCTTCDLATSHHLGGTIHPKLFNHSRYRENKSLEAKKIVIID